MRKASSRSVKTHLFPAFLKGGAAAAEPAAAFDFQLCVFPPFGTTAAANCDSPFPSQTNIPKIPGALDAANGINVVTGSLYLSETEYTGGDANRAGVTLTRSRNFARPRRDQQLLSSPREILRI